MLLITGATGFIGSRLCTRLAEQGRPFQCLVRDPSKARAAGLGGECVLPGDLLRPETLPRHLDAFSAVVHLAGVVRSLTARGFDEGNRLATRHLVQALARGAAPPLLVHVSSLAVVGPSPDGAGTGRRPEQCAPVSAYGASKRDAELEAAGAPSWIVLRPPVVYGPGDRDLLSVFRMAARGWLPSPGPAAPCTFLHVDDVVDAVLAAAGGTARSCHLPLAQVPALDAEALAGVLGEVFHRKVRVLRLPAAAARAAGALADLRARLRGRPSTFGSHKVAEMLAGPWVADPGPARVALGFAARRPPLQGFRETAAWYRERGLLRG